MTENLVTDVVFQLNNSTVLASAPSANGKPQVVLCF